MYACAYILGSVGFHIVLSKGFNVSYCSLYSFFNNTGLLFPSSFNSLYSVTVHSLFTSPICSFPSLEMMEILWNVPLLVSWLQQYSNLGMLVYKFKIIACKQKIAWDACLSRSLLILSVKCFPILIIYWQISYFSLFSQQNEISLWNCTMFLLSILQLLGIYEVSISWLLWIQQQWLCISKHLGNRIFPLSVLSTSSLRSQSILISIFWGNSTLIYPRVAPPVWIHSSAECLLLPHPW